MLVIANIKLDETVCPISADLTRLQALVVDGEEEVNWIYYWSEWRDVCQGRVKGTWFR
jgi:hypothetical protein